ncbi:MAG: hypothetical protein Q9183_000279 [Haloplaca sp. 2 TL-2023]
MASEQETLPHLEQIEIDDRVVDPSDRNKPGLPNPLTQTAQTLSRLLSQDGISNEDRNQAISAVKEAAQYLDKLRYFVKLRHSTLLMGFRRYYEPTSKTTRDASAALLKPMHQMDRKLGAWFTEMSGVIHLIDEGSKRRLRDLYQTHPRRTGRKTRAQLVREIMGGALRKGIRLCHVANDGGRLGCGENQT